MIFICNAKPEQPVAWRRRPPAGRRPCRYLLIAGGLVLALETLRVPVAYAQQMVSRTYDTYGEIGLLDMPSAHMAPDGELDFTVGDVGSAQRYNLTFQALPWLEASFRYVHVDPAPQDYQRNFSLKIRLSREGDYLPDMAVGIRDLIGANAYSAEYLVASKHIGDLDLTAGMGWGRLSGTGELPNPLGYISSSFNTRVEASVSTGGSVNLKKFFHGPRAGIFGGGIWHTPIDGLDLIAEYSTDKYPSEAAVPGGVKVRAPVNVGLSYRPYDALAFSGGWFYGSTYGFTVSLTGDTTSEPSTAERLGPQVPAPAIRSVSERQQALQLLAGQNPWHSGRAPVEFRASQGRQNLIAAMLSEGRGVRSVDTDGTTLIVDAANTGDLHAQCERYAQIAAAAGARYTTVAMADLEDASGAVTFCPIAVRANFIRDDGLPKRTARSTALELKLSSDLGKQNLLLEGLAVQNGELWLYYDNFYYRTEDEAIGRIVRVLMADAPPSIEIFHLVATLAGLPARNVTVVRSAVERIMATPGAADGFENAITSAPAPLDKPIAMRNLVPYPRWSWGLAPKLTEHIFDPTAPLQFQAYAQLVGNMQISQGLTLSSALTGNIWNDLTYSRSAGSQLPHVRTDLLRYLKEGQYGISFLGATYRTRLTPDVFAELKAGYLEDMYTGAGGQILWRPEDSRLAFGIDVYQVWKRAFNRLFGIQQYHILTGHASVYYRSPWYGLNFKLHVGRYLAGDYGGTFEITRQFSTGVEVGFYATFTNVPFSKFGEGSFDKGILLRIPFEWDLPIFSQSSYDLHLSSLTRDGGQRLANDDSLYDETERTSDGEIAQHFDEIITP